VVLLMKCCWGGPMAASERGLSKILELRDGSADRRSSVEAG
jgi:hypothetical protein